MSIFRRNNNVVHTSPEGFIELLAMNVDFIECYGTAEDKLQLAAGVFTFQANPEKFLNDFVLLVNNIINNMDEDLTGPVIYQAVQVSDPANN